MDVKIDETDPCREDEKAAEREDELYRQRVANEREQERLAGVPLSKRIDKLSKMDLEDIGEAAVAAVEKRIKRRAASEVKGEPVKFTGYWKWGTTQIYGFSRPASDITLVRIKGGQHQILDFPMNKSDRKKFALEMMRICGFKTYKKGSGHIVRIPSSGYGKKDGVEVYIGSK